MTAFFTFLSNVYGENVFVQGFEAFSSCFKAEKDGSDIAKITLVVTKTFATLSLIYCISRVLNALKRASGFSLALTYFPLTISVELLKITHNLQNKCSENLLTRMTAGVGEIFNGRIINPSREEIVEKMVKNTKFRGVIVCALQRTYLGLAIDWLGKGN